MPYSIQMSYTSVGQRKMPCTSVGQRTMSYGVATTSWLLKIIGLFDRISSLL